MWLGVFVKNKPSTNPSQTYHYNFTKRELSYFYQQTFNFDIPLHERHVQIVNYFLIANRPV
jgi:hypothetical protein